MSGGLLPALMLWSTSGRQECIIGACNVVSILESAEADFTILLHECCMSSASVS